MKHVMITSPIIKQFSEDKVKVIKEWDETKDDPAEEFIYEIINGPVLSPALYVKLKDLEGPVCTNASVIDLA